MADLHCQMSDYILSLVQNALASGEPIVRFMEYNYPHKGYHGIIDQFMLGEDVLVAPVITKGTRIRNVVFPEGTWKDAEGNLYEGDSKISVAAPLGKLLYYTREKCK